MFEQVKTETIGNNNETGSCVQFVSLEQTFALHFFLAFMRVRSGIQSVLLTDKNHMKGQDCCKLIQNQKAREHQHVVRTKMFPEAKYYRKRETPTRYCHRVEAKAVRKAVGGEGQSCDR